MWRTGRARPGATQRSWPPPAAADCSSGHAATTTTTTAAGAAAALGRMPCCGSGSLQRKDKAGASRQRSCTPVSRQSKVGHGASNGNAPRATPPLPLLQPPAPLPAAPPGPPAQIADEAQAAVDDYDGFLDDAGRTLPPPPPPDRMQPALDATIANTLAAPLSFQDGGVQAMHGGGEETHSSCMQPDLILACRAPAPAVATATQLGAVTQQVQQLQIEGPRSLFNDIPPPVIASAPPRRSAAPPKTRASSTPTRQSARQAAAHTTVPVAQRASLLLVKKLGMLH